ncbi:MAG TPA: hypothetical protein VJ936_10125, partial [Desulfobacteraceae bacterium]|nr:hypothetical protein [Desulfobacteraceae bacterium]
MAKVSITLQGIDQAIASLNYKASSTKAKCILAIRQHYTSEESISQLNPIDTDTLIQSVWDLEANPARIRAKRRNFSSIRSAITNDLNNLSRDDNPDNITLTPDNLFDMTEEAKNTILGSFTDAVKTG